MTTTDLRSSLQAIYDARGKLTPEILVEEARDPKHPLHDRLEWDDRVGGEAWRRAQAHELIQSVKIVYRDAVSGEERSLRAFHAVRTEKGHVYEPLNKVVEDPVLTRIVLADMEREWRQLKKRYDQFAEFWLLVRQDVPEAA